MRYSYDEITELMHKVAEDSNDKLDFSKYVEKDKYLLQSIELLFADTECTKKVFFHVLRALSKYCMARKSTIDIWDIPRIVQNSQFSKPLNIKERNIWGDTAVILDSDFIDFLSLTLEESNLVYTILKDGHGVTKLYNILTSYGNKYDNQSIRKLTFIHWGRIFENIIHNIEELCEERQKQELVVYIPFLSEYRKSTQYVISLFKLAIDIVEELLSCGLNSSTPAIEEQSSESTNLMQELMLDYARRQKDKTSRKAMVDEMMRRGVTVPTKDYDEYKNTYRLHFTSSNDALYYEDELDSHKVTIRDRIAVLHYMLYGYGIPRGVISKIFNYLTYFDDPKFTRVDSDDTAYTYLKQVDKFMQNPNRKEYVINTLKKFNYSDRTIKKLFPKQKK